MDIKNMHEMIEKLVGCAKSEFDKKGIEKINPEEMSKVTDMIKDLAEAQYYRTLVVAMEESEYGEDYDENGPMEEEHRKGYRGQRRNPRTGRYMRRGYDEMIPYDYDEMERMRDLDRHGMNRMYYSNGGGSRGYSEEMYYGGQGEGEFENAKRGYEETKMMHNGNTPDDANENMRALEKLFGVIDKNIKEIAPKMSPQEKTMAKNKLTSFAQQMQ